jgi:5-carboxymethyl-2-hydroxymuconate isomerase
MLDANRRGLLLNTLNTTGGEAMPHISVEYSANLEACVSVQGLCEALHAGALTTGQFELGAVRVRAVRCESYAVADCLAENAFAHLILRIGRGRSAAEKKAMGDMIFAAAESFLKPLFGAPHFALSFEIVEIDGDLSWKKNAIHPRLRSAGTK